MRTATINIPSYGGYRILFGLDGTIVATLDCESPTHHIKKWLLHGLVKCNDGIWRTIEGLVQSVNPTPCGSADPR
jgi:hypothetical protein